MQQYHQILNNIAEHGHPKGDRTGTGTTAYFGQHQRFALHHLFTPKIPVVTTKFTHLPSIEYENEWMISGDTRLEFLIQNGVRIWNEWVKPGTEVWRPLFVEEMRNAICKQYDIPVDEFYSVFTYGKEEQFIYRDIKESDNFDWTSYWAHGSCEISKALFVDAEAFRNAVSSQKPTEEDLKGDDLRTWNYFAKLYKLAMGTEPRKLMGGDLGPVYGKTWRDIDDVRIIPKLDWPEYEARGFSFVVDIPGTDHLTDRCVIQRKVDQLKDVLRMLGTSPEEDRIYNWDSRRIIICAWDPRLVEDQALPPCHAFIQFFTRALTLDERYAWQETKCQEMERRTQEVFAKTGDELLLMYPNVMRPMRFSNRSDEENHKSLDAIDVPRRAISCHMYQRSADTFLGVPFNITFYSLMTHKLANQFNMVAEEFIWTGGDTHIYSNHEDQVKLQLTRDCYATPGIEFKRESKGKSILDVTRDDYEITDYVYHAHIAGKVAK